MRICYLCPDPGVALAKFNGSARHVRSIVQAFLRQGHEVEAVLSRLEGSDELGIPVHPLPVFAFAGALLERTGPGQPTEGRSARAVARALRHVSINAAVERVLEERFARRRPDLVYERYSPFGAAGGLASRRAGVPHLLEVNAPLAWEGTRHRGQALQEAAELLERTAFDAAERIVAVSEELREHLIAQGVDASKIAVIPNGVDAELFTPEGPARRDGLGGKLVVGFSGSLKPWHGLEVLVEAFRELAADPRFHLLVVGDGPLAGLLHALKRELPDRVSLVSSAHPADMPAYLRSMDVAVAPFASQERFYFSPLKVLEYMAAGCTVVASRIGQPAALLRHGENGWLVPPGDASALSGAVRFLAADDDLRRRLGARAADETRRAHTWERRAARILDLVPAPV